MHERKRRRKARWAFKRLCAVAAWACFLAGLCIMGGIENGMPIIPLVVAAAAAMVGTWAFAEAADRT